MSDKTSALLDKAMTALHDVALAYAARRFLANPAVMLTAPLRQRLEEQALTDLQIEERCMDVWEQIAAKAAETVK